MYPCQNATPTNAHGVTLAPDYALIAYATEDPTAPENDSLDMPSHSSGSSQPATSTNSGATPGEVLLVHTTEGLAQSVESASGPASPILIPTTTDTKEYPTAPQCNSSPPASTSSQLMYLDGMNMNDSHLVPQQLPYSPPRDPHLPNDIESRQTKRELEDREAQIASLKEKITKFNENLRRMQEKELETLRPIMDDLHGKICAAQHEMARLWTDYTGRMSKAHEYTQEQVAELQKQIGSLEQENSNTKSLLAPIRCLPTELLAEIFVIVIECHEQNPFTVMRVCRSWRATVLSMARVWSRFTIRPWTSQEQMKLVVERTKQIPLDVVVDLSPSRHTFMHPIKVREGDGGLALAVATMPRWRTLTVAAFPCETDVTTAAGGDSFPATFSEPLGRLEAFRITGVCEPSVPFNRLLETVATTSTEQLIYVEVATPNALWFLASPNYQSVFARLKHFKVDVREMREPADILPYFKNLEVLEAYRLHLPTYHHDVDLPIVRSLKRMCIKIVSVQWMSGRTFPALEDCTIIWPHHPETLCMRGGVDLPMCTQFTYDDHLIAPMLEFRVPRLDRMVVRNEAWNKPRGSAQLASVWGESANPRWLKPRVLHLDTQCFDQHLINALQLHPDLEELVLGLVRPDGLGKKFFNSMVARRLRGTSSPLGSPPEPAQLNGASSGLLVAPLVPKLKVFGVRYRRWIRDEEKDEIRPLLEKIIQSREKSEVPLQSVKFWPTKETPEADADELVPPRI